VIKYTPSDHPDREPLEKVYENLMEIVNMVNERTRQVENVQRLIKLQKTIANPDVRNMHTTRNAHVAYALMRHTRG
jgi:GTP1/Obg family GTP-binding protein